MRIFLPIILLLFSLHSPAQPETKQVRAERINLPPKIDGQLNEAFWSLAHPVIDFMQTDPVFMATPCQATEVRICYDDRNLYVGAWMFDTAPDSILTQLGNRDDNLNADLFSISFDTYSNGLDAFTFEIYASGVQKDSRYTDRTFNAVWESAVIIDAKGWTAEIRIPWSSLRFPDNGEHSWRMQIQRTVRRHRETAQWSPEPKSSTNKMNYWGLLNGLSDIKAPVRLSVSPYLSVHGEHYPYNNPGLNNASLTFNGGADLKYGISKSFTIDMTLMPDFSTVASDHEIKNLSAFETVYDENREFFNEGMDLFMKGNLFYTRRIGRKPMHYDDVNDLIGEGGQLIRNPSRVQLINATKLSGRTTGNTGIGIFNALSANTYATYENTAGEDRKLLTEPFTNHNIVVVDQGLNFNSSAYIINTNVTRSNGYDNENVTGAGISYVGKSNTYKIDASGSISQAWLKATNGSKGKVDLGYRYNLGFSKIKGKIQYNLWNQMIDKGYTINGLGLIRRKDEMNNGARVAYNIYEPFWKLLRLSLNTGIDHTSRITTGKNVGLLWSTRSFVTTRKHTSLWVEFATDLLEKYDYYEPRTAGRYYIAPKFTGGEFNFSSDYRKPLALDGDIEFAVNTLGYKEIGIEIEPIVRMSDKWTIQHKVEWNKQLNDRGFVAKTEAGEIIFGERGLKTLENTFNSRYMFKNNLSLSLWMRHYWFRGEYNRFYTLSHTGKLEPLQGYTGHHDFNFNTFNIDLVFDWEFAPGSKMSIVYKNAVLHEDNGIVQGFGENLQRLAEAPQLNSITLRLLYFLDYQNVVRRKAQQDSRFSYTG